MSPESPLQPFLDDLAARMASAAERGKVADYIPELACIDPQRFGLAICLENGDAFEVGDARTPFSIQSISKVFTLAVALGRYGDQLWERVGREPSNHAFNSIVELEMLGGKPRNPFVNAGAIVVMDALLSGRTLGEALAELLDFIRSAAGSDTIKINEAVAASEARTGARNWSLAYFLSSVGNLDHTPDRALDAYFHHCAIEMSCVELARAGRFLAGIEPTGAMISATRVRRINALMMSCGHYDASGDFAFHVGLPGKSGVGGGILVIVPGVASVAVWSPGLNAFGNSHLGAQAMQALSDHAGWSLFAPR